MRSEMSATKPSILTRKGTGGAHCTASLKERSRREGGGAGNGSAKDGSTQHSFEN